MPKFSDSLLFIFKEKKGFSKLILIVVHGFITVISFLVAFLLAINSADLFLFIILVGVTLFLVVDYLLLYTWYEYESMQAGLESRETVAIWNLPGYGEPLKKSLKLIFTYSIYAIPVIVVVFLFSFLFSFFAVLMAQSGTIMPWFILLSTVLISVFISLYNVFILSIAKISLVSTNTFSKGIDLSRNLLLMRKNVDKISMAALYYVSYVALTVLLGFLLPLLGQIPLVGLALYILAIISLSIFQLFFNIFAFPHYLGSLFKSLKRLNS